MTLGAHVGRALAQASEHHGKSIKQCNEELRSNAAALAKAGESPAAFFHECWWRTAAGRPTRLRGRETGSASKGSAPAADTNKAQADADLTKAKQEAAAAKREAAAAVEAAKEAQARAAKAEATIKAQSESAASASAEAMKTKAAAKASAEAEANAKLAAQRAARTAAEARKRDATARVRPEGLPAAVADQAPVRPRHVVALRHPMVAQRRFVVAPQPRVVPPAERRRLFVTAARPSPAVAAASPSSAVVMVPVQIPGLGLKRPIPWPVFPAYVPAFRSVVNHPIVPGFTQTP